MSYPYQTSDVLSYVQQLTQQHGEPASHTVIRFRWGEADLVFAGEGLQPTHWAQIEGLIPLPGDEPRPDLLEQFPEIDERLKNTQASREEEPGPHSEPPPGEATYTTSETVSEGHSDEEDPVPDSPRAVAPGRGSSLRERSCARTMQAKGQRLGPAPFNGWCCVICGMPGHVGDELVVHGSYYAHEVCIEQELEREAIEEEEDERARVSGEGSDGPTLADPAGGERGDSPSWPPPAGDAEAETCEHCDEEPVAIVYASPHKDSPATKVCEACHGLPSVRRRRKNFERVK